MSTFASLGLSEKLLANLTQMGFEIPTPIQTQTIPLLLKEKQDLIALAQTGTGKTATFGLPLIEMLDAESKQTQALVLAPTRELCVQIATELQRYCHNVKHFNIVSVYGGASITDQIRAIRRGAQIIVATPGRLIDMLERKAINLTEIDFAVLDEADEMLNMGFKEDIDNILSQTPDTKKIWLFSATMPREVREIANNYMSKPLEVSVGERNSGNANITHQYVIVDERDKYEALKRLVDVTPDIFGLVFTRTKLDSQNIATQLITDGYNADALHGDLSQAQRDKVMGAFKNHGIQLLIATDVAARGIDVNDVTHVIHMNLPDELEYYTHRSGRTARAGKLGISIAITSRRDAARIKHIERIIRANFERIYVPTGEEVCENRLLKMIKDLHDVQINEREIEKMMPAVYEALADLSREDLIKRFTSLEFNRFLDYYRGSKDLNRNDDRRMSRDFEPRNTPQRSGGPRLFMNLGTLDGLTDKGKMVAFLTHYTGIRSGMIGKIEIMDKFSFFEVDPSVSQQVVQELTGIEFYGRKVRVNDDAKEQPRSGPPRERSFRSGPPAYGDKLYPKSGAGAPPSKFAKKKKY